MRPVSNCVLTAALALTASSALAQEKATKLIAVGDSAGNLTVTTLSTQVRASGTSNWGITFNSVANGVTTSGLYGSAGGTTGLVRTAGTVAGVTQNVFDVSGTAWGDVTTAGGFGVKATVSPAGQGLFIDNTVVAVAGQTVTLGGATYNWTTGANDLYWGAVGTNHTYFYGKAALSTNTATTKQGLFSYSGGVVTPILVTGDNFFGTTVGNTLAATSGLTASNSGNYWIGGVDVGGAATIVAGPSGGSPLTVGLANGAGPLRVGQVIGTANGASNSTDAFASFFGYNGINTRGDTLVSGRITGSIDVLLKNGRIIHKDNDVVSLLSNPAATYVLGPAMSSASMNDNGDYAAIWDGGSSSNKIVLVNGLAITGVGLGGIDLNGDGAVDPGVTWNSLVRVALGDLDNFGRFNVYLNGTVNGGASLGYADGTALVSVISVPEPAAMAVFAAAGGFLLARRRRAVK
jgi:hypothetical protein